MVKPGRQITNVKVEFTPNVVLERNGTAIIEIYIYGEFLPPPDLPTVLQPQTGLFDTTWPGRGEPPEENLPPGPFFVADVVLPAGVDIKSLRPLEGSVEKANKKLIMTSSHSETS